MTNAGYGKMESSSEHLPMVILLSTHPHSTFSHSTQAHNQAIIQYSHPLATVFYPYHAYLKICPNPFIAPVMTAIAHPNLKTPVPRHQMTDFLRQHTETQMNPQPGT